MPTKFEEIRSVTVQHQKSLEGLIPASAKESCKVTRIMDQIGYQIKFGRNGSKILSCEPQSVLAAVKYCCQAGLEPGYGNGTSDVYLIPYSNQLKAQTSYVGEIKLARMSGNFKKIFTKIVYEGDEFRQSVGIDGESFDHVIDTSGPRNDASVKLVYAVATTKDGEVYISTMSKDQIDELERKTRKKGMSPAWKDWWQAMAQKTVLRQLLKILPKTAEMSFVESEDNNDTLIDVKVDGVEPVSLEEIADEKDS